MTPGTIHHREAIDTSIAGAQAWRIRYSSRDYRGNPTESTGLVIAPEKASDNRPIVTWAHGTTGLGDAACPSSIPDPARELTIYFTPESSHVIDYGVPGLQNFIDAGWVVCATDYQGLGTPGMHHYMVNRTNALDALNIVHAARIMDVGAGTQFGCMGWSQGGAAAAAVAELDAQDFGDLTLVGIVPMSPGLIPLAMPALVGASLGAPTGPPGPPDAHFIMMLAGNAAAHPELHLSDLLSPLGVSIIDGAWNIQPVHHLNDTIGRLTRLEGAIFDVNAQAVPAWEAAVSAGSALQQKPVCPVFVAMDTFDGGTVSPVVWQQAYVAKVQAMGGTITSKEYPQADHFRLPGMCVADAFDWLKSQFTNS